MDAEANIEVSTTTSRRSREKPECSICMSLIHTKDKKILTCKHAFHRECIAQAYEFRNGDQALCPMCRHPYTLKFRSRNPKNNGSGSGSVGLVANNHDGEEPRVRQRAEIEAQREQEAIQDIISEDERFNRSIDEMCVKFDGLFQEVQTILPIDRDLQWLSARADIMRLLTINYR